MRIVHSSVSIEDALTFTVKYIIIVNKNKPGSWVHRKLGKKQKTKNWDVNWQ